MVEHTLDNRHWKFSRKTTRIETYGALRQNLFHDSAVLVVSVLRVYWKIVKYK